MKPVKHVVAKFRTWRDAEMASLMEYRRLTPAERVEIVFQLRSIAAKDPHADSERLARVYRIAQLKRG